MRKMRDLVCLEDDGIQERVKYQRQDRCSLLRICFLHRISGVNWDILARDAKRNNDGCNGEQGELHPQKRYFCDIDRLMSVGGKWPDVAVRVHSEGDEQDGVGVAREMTRPVAGNERQRRQNAGVRLDSCP